MILQTQSDCQYHLRGQCIAPGGGHCSFPDCAGDFKEKNSNEGNNESKVRISHKEDGWWLELDTPRYKAVVLLETPSKGSFVEKAFEAIEGKSCIVMEKKS